MVLLFASRSVLSVVLGLGMVACASAMPRPDQPDPSSSDQPVQGVDLVEPVPPEAAQTPVNPDVQIVADFQVRVQEYLALREKLEATLPDLPTRATAEQIQQHQAALERLIRQARPRARPGELLTPPLRAFIRRQVARVLGGTDGAKVRASLLDENVRGIKLQINGRYPDDVPLATVPPQLLLSLPRLPRELEFRFVGERLVLIDAPARTVIDFMDNALP